MHPPGLLNHEDAQNESLNESSEFNGKIMHFEKRSPYIVGTCNQYS